MAKVMAWSQWGAFRILEVIAAIEVLQAKEFKVTARDDKKDRCVLKISNA